MKTIDLLLLPAPATCWPLLNRFAAALKDCGLFPIAPLADSRGRWYRRRGRRGLCIPVFTIAGLPGHQRERVCTTARHRCCAVHVWHCHPRGYGNLRPSPLNKILLQATEETRRCICCKDPGNLPPGRCPPGRRSNTSTSFGWSCFSSGGTPTGGSSPASLQQMQRRVSPGCSAAGFC